MHITMVSTKFVAKHKTGIEVALFIDNKPTNIKIYAENEEEEKLLEEIFDFWNEHQHNKTYKS